jgi:hypothetical protein
MEQETEVETTPPDQPSISLQDLVLLLNLVRISADRGAIKAEEMSSVGTVYQKLFAFLKASGAISEESKEAN